MDYDEKKMGFSIAQAEMEEEADNCAVDRQDFKLFMRHFCIHFCVLVTEVNISLKINISAQLLKKGPAQESRVAINRESGQ